MNGTKKALNKYFEREAKKIQKEMSGKSRKNKSPEKAVVKNIMSTLRGYGFCLDVVEASNYDRIKQTSVHDVKIAAGYSDISGNDKFGFAVYIEAKSPGRRASLRELQRMFLEKKINSGAFACVADSVEHVICIYKKWIEAKKQKANSKEILLNDLPKKRVKRKNKGSDSGEEELDIFLK